MNKEKLDNILLDINKNHNWSWFEEILHRNKDNMNSIALYYRGSKITYKEMFDKIVEYSKSLSALGVKKGSEVPICMNNCPEFVYALGAISILGAKANIFGADFDTDYIRDILKNCNHDVILLTDDIYSNLGIVLKDINFDSKVVFSLTDSLPNKKNPFTCVDKNFYDFTSKLLDIKRFDSSVLDNEEFISLGFGMQFKKSSDSCLDDEFTITYSSGSTTSNKPKGIVHTNRSYITMGRFHDKDASETRPMKNMTVLASIPTFSNTNLASNISDTLMQGCTIALEPIYNKDFLLLSLIINKPNFVVTSKSFILHMVKNLPKENIKLPFLMALFAAGEGTSIGEEKYINKMLRKLKAGTKMLPSPISPVPLSIAGGDCEHGGFYFNLFKKYNDMLPAYLLRGETSGVKPFSMVDYCILDKEGKKCFPYTIGRLVANSPCSMKEYKNNFEANKDYYITDFNGKKWGDCKVFAYEDVLGRLHIKGRYIVNEKIIPPYMIGDIVLKDTKNILSCEIVPILDNKGEYSYVAHIELQPDRRVSVSNVLISIESRIRKSFDDSICNKIFYRLRSNDESFPLTPCGKRNNLELIAEGLSDKCIKPINNDDCYEFLNYSEYTSKNSEKKLLLK